MIDITDGRVFTIPEGLKHIELHVAGHKVVISPDIRTVVVTRLFHGGGGGAAGSYGGASGAYGASGGGVAR
jgi:hypothetical protein